MSTIKFEKLILLPELRKREIIFETIKVIKSPYESTLNGLSSKFDELLVIGGASDEELNILRKSENYKNALIYVERNLWGERHDYLKPLHDKPNTLTSMYGGNMALFPEGLKMKIHDRYETYEEYERYSK